MVARFPSLTTLLLALCVLPAFAQSPAPTQNGPNEADEILQESKKQDPETPKEIAECMKQWGPQTQMTKEEWAASCRRTLRCFRRARKHFEQKVQSPHCYWAGRTADNRGAGCLLKFLHFEVAAVSR